MHEYFQANTENPMNTEDSMNNSAELDTTAMNNSAELDTTAMNNSAELDTTAMNNESMNNSAQLDTTAMNNSVMTDEQLSCQAALQTAMDKCVSEPVTSEALEDTLSDPFSSGEPVIEGFKNPTQLWQPNVKLLLNVLIMMCVFYLLSHFETGKYLSSLVKGLKGRNLHLLLTLLFGLVYLLLKKYL